MAASLEFPNNCSTNVYTLNDFGEIAYIVCTVATPPSQDPAAFVSTPENALARLRKTERQFRETSILAALDVENRQLFTFYKKVDIANAKDQKALLTKFGYVLRSNTCTIAYKTAARLPDLMKPEQFRLYRLFATAIISSIKLLPNGDSALRPFGPNLYLVQESSLDSEVDHFRPPELWSLHRVDLQVIPSGYIILTIVKERRHTFRRVVDVEKDLDSERVTSQANLPLYLTPLGRVARLVGVENDTASKASEGDQGHQLTGSQNLDPGKELWRDILPTWLEANTNISLGSEDITWVEAQVAVHESEHLSTDTTSVSTTNSGKSGTVTWRTLFWPASLCFVLHREPASLIESFGDYRDPMRFIRDWIAGTINEKPNNRRGVDMVNVAEDDDEPLFAENGTFDDPEHFQPFGPPALPASQTIYPTPPDAVMTYATPGLSSIDGIAMTPANMPGKPPSTARRPDVEMQDLEGLNNDSAMSEFYDEDLFDEMPEDDFGQGGTADEPNWDFFDRPGVDSKPTPAMLSNQAEGFSKQGDTDMYAFDENIGTSLPSDGRDYHNSVNAESDMLMSDQADTGNHQSPERIEDPDTVETRASQQENRQSNTSKRRSSSIYERPKQPMKSSDRDYKYSANGDFWFDPSPVALKSGASAFKISSTMGIISSSSSDDEISMNSRSSSRAMESGGRNSPMLSRQWTEYHPEPPAIVNLHDEVEWAAAEADIKQLLEVLKPGSTETTPVVDPQRLNTINGIDQLTSQKFLQIAHILVDQISQTSLISHAEKGQHRNLSDGDLEIVADLRGMNSSANASTLSQLVSLKADYNTVKLHGKLIKLQPNQIGLKRADQPLIASMSIMAFWDSLSLQPAHGLKNVTSFCIHPDAEDVADGCSTLLQRMSDTYNTCAFGSHAIGRLSGVANDGMIAWSPSESAPLNLHHACQRMGTAIGAVTNLTGTVLVYMISDSDSPASYLKICLAFSGLFEAFVAKADKKHVTDIALQIVPRSFITSPESLIVPPQSSYLKLAIEVYNRLPPADPGGSPAACETAIVLAKAENSVHLQLASIYASPLSRNGDYLHLAYSASPDGRWITAAWSDDFGHLSLTMSYCARRRDSTRVRPQQEILKEMWQVSHDLMSRTQGLWRLGVIKQGYYTLKELRDWRQIFESSTTSQKRCLPMLLSAQLDPMLRIFTHMVSGKPAQPSQNLYGTPVSTPQAGVTSPDQLVPATPTPGGTSMINASTPPEPGLDPNVDGDLTLVDPAEDSWGIILPYGLNQSTNMVELRPALATGVLLKRRGPKLEDGCISIEVSLIYLPSQAADGLGEATPDELLEDVIKQYRGLLSLGVTRGCIDPSNECIPWHIATAVRGSKALGQVM
ncbi:hypothetical protein LTR93_006530 [Exophiala xenobiotica]|nr:hypothetical protein LTR93_006530 [Exophiala xenobiotica]KAK5412573.1 hypothetical protein LTR06_005543 [Exophiala xenobiotica]